MGGVLNSGSETNDSDGGDIAKTEDEFDGRLLLHIEELAKRATLDADFSIAPHTHLNALQIIFFENGKAKFHTDDQTLDLVGPCVVVIPGGMVHGVSFSKEPMGWALTVSERMLDGSHLRRSRQLLGSVFHTCHVFHIEGASKLVDELKNAFERLVDEAQSAQLGQGLMLEWQVHILLMLIRRQTVTKDTKVGMQKEHCRLYTAFRKLLERYYQEHWSASKYAEKLCITSSRLNRICKDRTQKSTSELISDRLLLEIERRLIYTSQTAADIGFVLGFEDPAYFSRFFKRRTQKSPLAFRNESRKRLKLNSASCDIDDQLRI